jgi:hypothetical protein
VCVPLFNKNAVETLRPGSKDRPAVKYAATPFTNLNYSIPEPVRASVDLVVTAVDGFKTSVTYTINQRARVKLVDRHCRSLAPALSLHLLYTACVSNNTSVRASYWQKSVLTFYRRSADRFI